MRSKKFGWNYDDKEIHLTFVIDNDISGKMLLEDLSRIIDNGKEVEFTAKQYRKKRSLDANAYCFIICDKIAKKLNSTKELVYQDMIKKVGECEIIPIREDALTRWIRNWELKGLGWQVEILGKSKLKGYINTVNYYGSSVYDTKAMSLLIEEIVYAAKELSIETKTPEELYRLAEMWGEK